MNKKNIYIDTSVHDSAACTQKRFSKYEAQGEYVARMCFYLFFLLLFIYFFYIELDLLIYVKGANNSGVSLLILEIAVIGNAWLCCP